MFVNGWALEASLENTGGVSEVRVALDGVTIKNSRVNCHREFLLSNALIDCYGYYRPGHRGPVPRLRAGAERRLPVLRRRGLPPHAEGLPRGRAHPPGVGRRQAEHRGPPEGSADHDGVRDRPARPAAARLHRRPDELQVHRRRLPGDRLGAGPRRRREGPDPDRRRAAGGRGHGRGLGRLRLREPRRRDDVSRSTRSARTRASASTSTRRRSRTPSTTCSSRSRTRAATSAPPARAASSWTTTRSSAEPREREERPKRRFS